MKKTVNKIADVTLHIIEVIAITSGIAFCFARKNIKESFKKKREKK
tara:strand:- start:383 stop:520 length:138 start_codon:yes stop_codon:yes gene_type:complete